MAKHRKEIRRAQSRKERLPVSTVRDDWQLAGSRVAHGLCDELERVSPLAMLHLEVKAICSVENMSDGNGITYG